MSDKSSWNWFKVLIIFALVILILSSLADGTLELN